MSTCGQPGQKLSLSWPVAGDTLPKIFSNDVLINDFNGNRLSTRIANKLIRDGGSGDGRDNKLFSDLNCNRIVP